MTIEIVFILLLIVACYFSWIGGTNEGFDLGVESGVYTTIHNLESGGIIKVINYDDGRSVIKAVDFTELHVNANGNVKTIITQHKQDVESIITQHKQDVRSIIDQHQQDKENVCEEKK